MKLKICDTRRVIYKILKIIETSKLKIILYSRIACVKRIVSICTLICNLLSTFNFLKNNKYEYNRNIDIRRLSNKYFFPPYFLSFFYVYFIAEETQISVETFYILKVF